MLWFLTSTCKLWKDYIENVLPPPLSSHNHRNVWKHAKHAKKNLFFQEPGPDILLDLGERKGGRECSAGWKKVRRGIGCHFRHRIPPRVNSISQLIHARRNCVKFQHLSWQPESDPFVWNPGRDLKYYFLTSNISSVWRYGAQWSLESMQEISDWNGRLTSIS